MSKKFKSVEKSLKNFFEDIEKETEEMFGEGSFLDMLLSRNKGNKQPEGKDQNVQNIQKKLK